MIFGKKLFAYFGHHKCATVWIHSILSAVCKEIGLHFVEVHSPNQFDRNLKDFIKRENVDFFSYTNAHIEFVSQLDNYVGFHVIRDPRDMIVSAYFSHLYSHPTDIWEKLIEYRMKLSKLSKDEGLFMEMEFSKPVLMALKTWDYNRENILELKLEDLSKNAYEDFVTIFEFLGLLDDSEQAQSKQEILLEKILGIVYRNRFSAKTKGRKQKEENVKHHFRKGAAGDWKNHFNPDHITQFNRLYGDLLIKLGYENE